MSTYAQTARFDTGRALPETEVRRIATPVFGVRHLPRRMLIWRSISASTCVAPS